MRRWIERRRTPRNWIRAWTRTVRWEPPYAIPCAITYVRSPAGTNVVWLVNDSTSGQLIGVLGWEIYNDNPLNGPIMLASRSWGGSKVATGRPLSAIDPAQPGALYLQSVAGALSPYIYTSPGNVDFSMRQESPRLVIPPLWALGVEFGVFAGTGQLSIYYSVYQP